MTITYRHADLDCDGDVRYYINSFASDAKRFAGKRCEWPQREQAIGAELARHAARLLMKSRGVTAELAHVAQHQPAW